MVVINSLSNYKLADSLLVLAKDSVNKPKPVHMFVVNNSRKLIISITCSQASDSNNPLSRYLGPSFEVFFVSFKNLINIYWDVCK